MDSEATRCRIRKSRFDNNLEEDNRSRKLELEEGVPDCRHLEGMMEAK